MMEHIIFPDSVVVTDQTVDCTQMSAAKKSFALDFTERIIADFKDSGKTRISFGIAGPSGSGKSFLSVLAHELGKQIDPSVDIVPISIDAYHFPNTYLESTHKDGVSLKDVKGRYDTYDVEALVTSLEAYRDGARVQFPEYSRRLHEPVSNVISVSDHPTILLVEGLWLLRKEGGWGNVRPLLDKVFYIEDIAEESRTRTLKRHIAGGRSEQDARRQYESSDAKNREIVMLTKSTADEFLTWPE
jgi:pantothenate kinase